MCRDFTQKPIHKFRTDYSIGWLGLSWEPSPNASSTSLQQTRNYFVACVITKSISDHRKTLFLSASKGDIFRSVCKSWAATPFLQLHVFFQSLSLNWVQAKKGDFQPILSRAQAPVLIFSEEERQQTWVAQTRASLSIYCCWRQRIFFFRFLFFQYCLNPFPQELLLLFISTFRHQPPASLLWIDGIERFPNSTLIQPLLAAEVLKKNSIHFDFFFFVFFFFFKVFNFNP